LQSAREKFLREQWPGIRATIARLGLQPEALLKPEIPEEKEV
jgi:hypothetical protein